MPTRSSSRSARIFAPAALAVCALAVLVVIGSSIGGGDSSDGGGAPASETANGQATGNAPAPQPREPAEYTIESGDTLGGIAEQTGVPVETLQMLNPELDPQALIAGQKIKLRE